MNTLLKFNEITHTCLLDINSQITECKKQVTSTQQIIQKLEKSEASCSVKELVKIIQKKHQLLIDNYVLITQQIILIKHYTVLSNMMKKHTNNSVSIFKVKNNDIKNLSEIILYFKNQNQLTISNLLKQYLP